jgi:hypothetical protein
MKKRLRASKRKRKVHKNILWSPKLAVAAIVMRSSQKAFQIFGIFSVFLIQLTTLSSQQQQQQHKKILQLKTFLNREERSETILSANFSLFINNKNIQHFSILLSAKDFHFHAKFHFIFVVSSL